MTTSVALLLNTESHGHADVLAENLSGASHLECLVAFAKMSSEEGFLKHLESALERGMAARIAVGLSFHLSEPGLLYHLLELTKKYSLELYISATNWTFHPKIYAFRKSAGFSVVVGSANLTSGGLGENYEASISATDRAGVLFGEVEAHFSALIDDGTLVKADKSAINVYARDFVIHDSFRRLANKRADRVVRFKTTDAVVLADKLEMMKRDHSDSGFLAQRQLRLENLELAKELIQSISGLGHLDAKDFISHYETLIERFHSYGLHRKKGDVTRVPSRVAAALADISSRTDLSASDAFDVLSDHFSNIKGAGINLLTEVLHALDNKRYAVMNQNSVSGLLVAGVQSYPLHPSKASVNGASYEKFCSDAIKIQCELGLDNLTELDALLNYVYWL